jgi:hypothetical protein
LIHESLGAVLSTVEGFTMSSQVSDTGAMSAPEHEIRKSAATPEKKRFDSFIGRNGEKKVGAFFHLGVSPFGSRL